MFGEQKADDRLRRWRRGRGGSVVEGVMTIADAGDRMVDARGGGPGATPGDGLRRLSREAVKAWARRQDWARVGLILGLLMFAGASIVIYRLLEETSWADVKSALDNVGWRSLALSALATVVSYGALIGYDVLALRHVGARSIPFTAIALTSFISNAFTYTLGFGVVTGGAVRWRLYSNFALDPARIIAVGLLCMLTFWLGVAAAAGLSLVIDPDALAPIEGDKAILGFLIGAAIVTGLIAWAALSALRPRSITISGWTMRLPGPRMTLGAILVGLVDTGAAALAFWLLLPAGTDDTFVQVLAVFAIATALGVISHVPGGVGVFEATLILGLPGVPQADLVGALLLFRLVYFGLPFVVAAVSLVAYDLAYRRATVGRVAKTVGTMASAMVPRAAGVAVFLGGAVLLISGATPAEHDRIHMLRNLVPLPFVEASHFAGSVTGLILLIVADGLVRRMANAWRVAVVLLTAGAIFSILKGLDFEEAIVCSTVVALLLASRHEFHRQADLFAVRPSFEWVIAVIVAVGASIWLGFFVSRNVEYETMLWWDFAYRADAPRFLRATLGVVVAAIGIAAWILLHRTRVAVDPAGEEGIAEIKPLAEASTRSDANLALLGDKCFLVDRAHSGFVMYGVQGRSWIAMGDPVAPEEEIDGLVWRFKELVDRAGGTPVFYQVTTAHLPAYLDAGFSLVKLGEEAWVDLEAFTLDGSKGRRLRQSKSKAEREGARFEIVPAEGVAAIIDELEAVSDAWLATKGGKEKGFSLGFWSRPYVLRHDVAIVRHSERITAFANLWRGGGRREFTVDLMRHRPDAPPGTMDLLFIGLLSQAKSEGFRAFNLGMAPLSGLATHRLASLWSRIGAFLYRRGDRFYNFEGLRAFKNKFSPEWRPRYLAYPGGLGLPKILMDVTGLIAASPKRAFDMESQ
jgi:phosphatidylglycerol lysyltransferase